MKFLVSLIIFTTMLAGISQRGSSLITPQGTNDLSECVKKYNSEWGRTCSACKQEGNTYTVFLRNECSQAVDVKCAVQEVEKRWRCFIRLNLAIKDTMTGYACNSSGKYLYWVRKAGDKTIVFPSDEEINTNYSK